jgi:plasmid stabilization system protein ParE
MMSYAHTPDSLEDIGNVRDYYNGIRKGLGDEFLNEFDYFMDLVCRNPESFDPVGTLGYRRAILDRFPYAVIYRVDRDVVIVTVVVHTSKAPKAWLRRLK